MADGGWIIAGLLLVILAAAVGERWNRR